KSACTPVRGASPVPDLWAIIVAVGVIIGIIAGLFAIGSVVIAVEKRWHPFRQVWGWLYRHTNHYRIEQLQTHLDGLTHVHALETERKDAQINALQEQIADQESATLKALWQLLRLQTNANNYIDNTTTLEEFVTLLVKWTGKSGSRASENDP